MSISLLTCALGWDWDERQILPRIRNPLSKQFRSRTADVTYRSSDGVLFRIHSLYLKTHTEALDPPDGISLAEVAELAEDSQTLDLLFRFVYPIPQPKLELLKFDVLRKLAEAAEKYGVYPAMSCCKLSMEKFLKIYPLEILLYAARHDHRDLLDQAALLHLKKPVEVAIQGMPEYAVLWVRYYAAWDHVRRKALNQLCRLYSTGGCPSSEWALLKKLHSDLTWIQHFQSITTSWPPEISSLLLACDRSNFQQRNGVSIQQAVQRIPTFSQFRHLSNAGRRDSRIANPPSERRRRVHHETVNRYHSPFSDEEIIFCSTDGKQFAVHRAVIKASGDGFPLPGINDEVVLSEDGFTLDLLMKFIHKMAQPDLTDLEYEQLEALAMAAHKYKVHYATTICTIFLKKFTKSRSLPMLIYALRVKDYDVMNLVTPCVLDMCFKEVVTQLPDDLLLIWTGYHAQWKNAAEKAFNIFLQRPAGTSQMNSYGYPYRRNSCSWCSSGDQYREILSRLGDGIAGFRKLRAAMVDEQSVSAPCIDSCAAWVPSFNRACRKSIEPFSSFVNRMERSSRLW